MTIDLKDIRARREVERKQADALAATCLTSHELQLWRRFASVWREPVWLNRAYRIHKGGKTLLNFKVVDCDAEFEFGLNAKLQAIDGRTQWVGHQPALIFGCEIFTWVPSLLEARYLNNGHGSARSFSFPLTFKAEFDSRRQVLSHGTYIQNIAN